MKAGPREAEIQGDIMVALGALPDVRVFRNAVGAVNVYVPETGKSQYVTFGLAPGSSDLVCMLCVEHAGRGIARWVCLEVKRPGERPTPEQARWAAAVRRVGAFAACVCSVEEALAAVQRAREGGYE